MVLRNARPGRGRLRPGVQAYGSTDPMAWNQDFPATCTPASFLEVVGALGLGTGQRRLGISYQVQVAVHLCVCVRVKRLNVRSCVQA
jgi:hypothetical protein